MKRYLQKIGKIADKLEQADYDGLFKKNIETNEIE